MSRCRRKTADLPIFPSTSGNISLSEQSSKVMSDELDRLNNLAIEQHIVVRGSMGFAEGSRGRFCRPASFPIKGIAVDA